MSDTKRRRALCFQFVLAEISRTGIQGNNSYQFSSRRRKDKAGLVIMSQTRAYIAFYNRGDEIRLFSVNSSIKPYAVYSEVGWFRAD